MKTYKQVQYAGRRQAGICVRCGDPRNRLRRKANGTRGVECEDCHDAHLAGNRKYIRKQRRKARRRGICTTCLDRLAMPGATRCGVCAEENMDRLNALRSARREAGLCPACGEIPDKGYVWCARCIRRQISLRKLRSAA